MYYIIRLWFVLSNVICLTCNWILSLIRYKKPSNIPPITNPLLMLSATEIAKKIRERKYRSYDVVLAYIERIKEVNPYLNAVVDERYQDALTEAKNYDVLLETDKVDTVTLKKEKPLYGVPFTVKESCPLKGLSNSGCTLPLKGRKAKDDSVIVKKLRDAGAIPLCVTNTPEMCCSFDTFNYVYGRTYNPYDTRYTAGGSSGGEGALLGAGASLIGIGSDLGGSIRIPAFFCGHFAFKPTSKVIYTRDHFPIKENGNLLDYLTFGPMTRYADDLSLFMKVATESNVDLCLDEPVDWKQTRIYYKRDLGKAGIGILPLSPEIEQCILKAVNYFSGRGVNTEQIPIKWPPKLLEMLITQYMNIGKMDIVLDIKNPKRTKNSIVELIKSVFGMSYYTMSMLYFSSLPLIAELLASKEERSHYTQKLKKFQQELQELLGKNGLLIYPVFRVTAPFPEITFGEIGGAIAFAGLLNIFGFPAVQVPMGFNSKGLPIGIQIIAGPYQDRLCLAAAKELEKAFGGWVPPSISLNN